MRKFYKEALENRKKKKRSIRVCVTRRGVLRRTACPNQVALRFGLEATFKFELPQSGLTTLTGGCGWDIELRTRSKGMLGIVRKVERLKVLGKAGKSVDVLGVESASVHGF